MLEFPRMYSEKEAALYLTVSLSTMRRWRRAGAGPDFFKIGNVLRYRQGALEVFIKQFTRSAA